MSVDATSSDIMLAYTFFFFFSNLGQTGVVVGSLSAGVDFVAIPTTMTVWVTGMFSETKTWIFRVHNLLLILKQLKLYQVYTLTTLKNEFNPSLQYLIPKPQCIQYMLYLFMYTNLESGCLQY